MFTLCLSCSRFERKPIQTFRQCPCVVFPLPFNDSVLLCAFFGRRLNRSFGPEKRAEAAAGHFLTLRPLDGQTESEMIHFGGWPLLLLVCKNSFKMFNGKVV